MKTRTKKLAGSKASRAESQDAPANPPSLLEPSVEEPPHLFILPKNLSRDSRIVTLPCPATDLPNRFLVCPDKGFFEFTRIAAPKQACRSWLLTPQEPQVDQSTRPHDGIETIPAMTREGYVLQQPALFTTTPVDPIFVILPVLAAEGLKVDRTGKLLSLDEHIDMLYSRAPVLRNIEGMERHFVDRMDAICDSVLVGDEKMYRLSILKLYEEVVRKARLVIAKGLPAGMEETFVKQTLAVPETGSQREDSTISIAHERTAQEDQPTDTVKNESQDSGYETQEPSSSADGKRHSSEASHEVANLLRIRIAMDFIEDSYLAPSLRSAMKSFRTLTKAEAMQLHHSTNLVDFLPLTTHIAKLDDKKKEAQALRSLSDNISRKRPVADDDDAMEKVEAKKRKKEEEEAKKKNMTRGVKQLEKVDRSGMKKLSSFFSKTPAKK